ncbi:MAG: excinuclease ABC subunit UvrC [Nitrospirota bacterium]
MLSVDIQNKLKVLPDSPGVYLMKDRNGRVLYVGKAKSLRERVRAYFSDSSDLDSRKRSMVKDVVDIEYIVTITDMEALLLEANLIKKHKPRFNVVLRDDKNYPYLRLSPKEKWPRIQVVRKVKNDGAMYFGPYVPSGPMWETLSFIRKTFPLRTCNLKFDKINRPCLESQIGRCIAPCSGVVSTEQYDEIANEVKLFLQGRNTDLIDKLKIRMYKAAEDMHFEEAASIRNKIKAIERIIEKQRIIEPSLEDIDVIGFAREGVVGIATVLFIRNGMLLGKKDLFLDNLEGVEDTDALVTLIEQFYSGEKLIPHEIIIPADIPDRHRIEGWLSLKRRGSVEVLIPKRGKRYEIQRMADENARALLRDYLLSRKGSEVVLQELMKELELKRLPIRIEAFDISNIHGEEAVGSMVVWESNSPKRSGYRHFKIRTVDGADDFAMMYEVVNRRYRRLLEEDNNLPDLIIVDGGKGQLNAAISALAELGLSTKDMDIIGLAKEKIVEGRESRVERRKSREESREKKFERVYLPGKSDPIVLTPTSAVTHLLQRIRDEAHRFAISHHRKLRKKKAVLSILDGIRGVGKTRKVALLRHFGDIKRLRKASLDEIASVKGMTKKSAEAVYNSLKEM